MFNFFENIPSEYVIYSLYGSAFLFLGFAIFIKDMKGSDLKLADSLWLLGMFGLTHGAHELLEVYPLIEGDHLSLLQIFNAKSLSLAVLVVSYLFLLQFGLVLARGPHDKPPLWYKAIPAILIFAWVVLMVWFVFTGEQGYTKSMRFLGHAETAARHLFCLTGTLLTAYGLLAYSRKLKILSISVSRHLRHAGYSFIFYGIFAGVFVNRFSIIPLPFPVELLRAVSAVCITYFIVRALNIFNIETRKRAELQTRRLVQTEKLTSLGRLAAGIAHEINNPLTNASLAVQMLNTSLKNGHEDNFPGKLEEIEKYIDRASAIASELLQFSRQKESEPVPVNMNEVISGALMLLGHKLKNIVVQPNLAPVHDVMGDPGKLEQVFINIVSNSIEAMPGGGEILIASSQQDGQVQVTMTDTGAGISEEHLSRVFDPFFTTKEVGAGTGLGLSICYGIIAQHHGVIEITSLKGRGTTVTIKIPFMGVT